LMNDRRVLPLYGWVGLALVVLCWTLNWTLPGLRTHFLFFPLWLGYCLFVDACVFLRKGTSLITRSWRKYLGLFLVSAPAWWLFELLNLVTQNWIYIGREFFTDLEYALLATISFSTVMPAVFGTAEWIGSFGWFQRQGRGVIISATRSTLAAFFLIGMGMLAFMLLWPEYGFPFLWLSVFFILEPINALRGRSLAEYTRQGNWRPVLALWLGALLCGFCWELWNFYAYPKWVYRVPYVDCWHVFEMPLLGYGGYLPFSMELFALYHMVIWLVRPGQKGDYLQLV